MDMEIDYPNNYAGACFNADGSQKLDIYLTDDNKDAYLEILDQNIVNFHNAEFSMDELIYAKELIDPYIIEYNISILALVQQDNTIEITGNNDFDKESFYELTTALDVDSDIYTIKNTVAKTSCTATKSTALAGDNVGVGSSVGTVGFNAYNNRTKEFGIVTAGHLLSNQKPENMIYAGGSFINAVGNSTKIDTNSSCDAAFIPFYSMDHWQQTAMFNCTSEFGFIKSYTYPTSCLEETMLTKYGISSNKQTGYITSISATISDGSTVNYDTLECSNYNKSGDSGGPIGIVSGSSSPYNMSIVGITTSTDCSKNEYNPDGSLKFAAGNTYASKITNIIGYFGLNIVT